MTVILFIKLYQALTSKSSRGEAKFIAYLLRPNRSKHEEANTKTSTTAGLFDSLRCAAVAQDDSHLVWAWI
jgi:hypothetical protein